MAHKKTWDKTDNSMEAQKAELRIKYLPENAHVLDLFCGNGKMYESAYRNRVIHYHGVDKEKVHNLDICTLADNINFISTNDITKYNVFDLDDYGTPWKLLYLILRKLHRDKVTIFITDGLVLRQKMAGTVTKFVSATERVPQKMNLPGINRFYVDIFATMLKDVERRYGWETEKAVYFHNKKRTVYYWAVKLQHTP